MSHFSPLVSRVASPSADLRSPLTQFSVNTPDVPIINPYDPTTPLGMPRPNTPPPEPAPFALGSPEPKSSSSGSDNGEDPPVGDKQKEVVSVSGRAKSSSIQEDIEGVIDDAAMVHEAMQNVDALFNGIWSSEPLKKDALHWEVRQVEQTLQAQLRSVRSLKRKLGLIGYVPPSSRPIQKKKTYFIEKNDGQLHCETHFEKVEVHDLDSNEI